MGSCISCSAEERTRIQQKQHTGDKSLSQHTEPLCFSQLQVLAKVLNLKLQAAWASWLNFVDSRCETRQKMQRAASFWLNGSLAAAFTW